MTLRRLAPFYHSLLLELDIGKAEQISCLLRAVFWYKCVAKGRDVVLRMRASYECLRPGDRYSFPNKLASNFNLTSLRSLVAPYFVTVTSIHCNPGRYISVANIFCRVSSCNHCVSEPVTIAIMCKTRFPCRCTILWLKINLYLCINILNMRPRGAKVTNIVQD